MLHSELRGCVFTGWPTFIMAGIHLFHALNLFNIQRWQPAEVKTIWVVSTLDRNETPPTGPDRSDKLLTVTQELYITHILRTAQEKPELSSSSS